MAEPTVNLTSTSSIESIDMAIYEWLDRELNISCQTQDGFTKVPILWVTPERSFQIKNNKDLRDINGTINPPLIAIERGIINKDPKNNGVYFANLPPNLDVIKIARRINQEKTSEFQKADRARQTGKISFVKPRESKKVVYEYTTLMAPIYVVINYTITIFSMYVQQMNTILQPFITKTGSTRYFVFGKEGYLYEAFIEGNIETKNNFNNLEQEERKVISTINLKIIADVNSDGPNEADRITKTYENAVEVRLPKFETSYFKKQ
jgi:hypothetical protein